MLCPLSCNIKPPSLGHKTYYSGWKGQLWAGEAYGGGFTWVQMTLWQGNKGGHKKGTMLHKPEDEQEK